jgi:hypothetical protein
MGYVWENIIYNSTTYIKGTDLKVFNKYKPNLVINYNRECGESLMYCKV